MKKTGLLSILLVLCLILSGFSAMAEAGNVFTASAQGFGGDITVSLTIEDGKLTDVVVEGPNETQGVGSNAVDMMPGMMLKANSVEVDTVTGCTISSTAILTAAKEGLEASGMTLTAAEPEAEETASAAMTPRHLYRRGLWQVAEGLHRGRALRFPRHHRAYPGVRHRG